MKLAYVDPHPLTHPLPAVMQIIQTVDAIAALGAEVELIVPDAGAPHAIREVLGRDLNPRANITAIPDLSRHWWFPFHTNRPFFWRARRYLTHGHFDALLVRNIKLAGRLLNTRKLPPLFFETHEIFAQSFLDAHPGASRTKRNKYARLLALERHVYTRSTGLIAITAALAQDVRAQFDIRCPISVAPDGVDLALAENARSRVTPKANPTLLYLGSLHSWKGVETLIDAMREVRGATLWIAGGEAQRIHALAERARASGVSEHVRFLGRIPPARRFDLIGEATICLLPLTHDSIASRYTSPLKLFEYMAMGKPIIAGDLPSIREVLITERNGLLVPPQDPSALAAAIKRLLDDPDLAEKLGQRAAADAQAYSWQARAQTILTQMQQVLAGRAIART
ncbi:MAG: glycosyltransferase family 4 protein [Burkholderiales bacterium]